jgi:hypothetical protein
VLHDEALFSVNVLRVSFLAKNSEINCNPDEVKRREAEKGPASDSPECQGELIIFFTRRDIKNTYQH